MRARFNEIAADAAGPTAPPRGARLPKFVGLKHELRPLLDALTIAVVGAGSVGRNLCIGTARLQPAVMWIVDPAQYKLESLLTHSIAPGDVDQSKAFNTARMCKRISPSTRIYACDRRVEQLPWAAFAESHLVLLATDNLAAEVDVGQRCLHLGKPLIHASLQGEFLAAQVRFFAKTGMRQGPARSAALASPSGLNSMPRPRSVATGVAVPASPRAKSRLPQRRA